MLGLSAVSENPVSYVASANNAAPVEPPAEAFRGISHRLVTRAGVPQINLSGLGWSLFSQLSAGTLGAPVAQGTLESTDGGAFLQIPLTVGQAASGQYFLAMSNADNSSTILAVVTVG